MKTMKRIYKVVIKQMYDESPDTSWLGEYGRRAESDYAIDREHATDCQYQTYNKPVAVIDKLERAIAYLNHSGDELTGEAFDDSLTILGECQNDLTECDCCGGSRDRNSYQFFNPNHENYAGLPEDEIRKYCLQDYARMESLNNQEFCFIGIRAEAEYYTATSADAKTGKHGAFLMQTLTSAGCWGIESDSEPAHFKSIEDEELHELKAELKAIGFSSRAIATAFKNVERKEL